MARKRDTMDRNAAELDELRRLPPQVLETVADILMSTWEGTGVRTYTEPQLGRKCRDSNDADSMISASVAPSDDSLLQTEVEALAAAAGLSDLERRAWELHIAGWSALGIAEHLRVSRPTVVRLINTAGRRIAVCRGGIRGIHEVYRQETHPSIYRKPEHCDDQHCRRLGYCRFAR